MGTILTALCEDAHVDGDGRLTLVRIFRTIECGHFPYHHARMVLACSIPVTLANYLDRWLVQVDLIDPDGRQLARVVNDSRLMVGYEKEPSSFSFTAEIKNMTFYSPGDYQFSLLINGTIVDSVGLHLVPVKTWLEKRPREPLLARTAYACAFDGIEQREIPQEVRNLVSFKPGSTIPSSATLVTTRGQTSMYPDNVLDRGGSGT